MLGALDANGNIPDCKAIQDSTLNLTVISDIVAMDIKKAQALLLRQVTGLGAAPTKVVNAKKPPLKLRNMMFKEKSIFSKRN